MGELLEAYKASLEADKEYQDQKKMEEKKENDKYNKLDSSIRKIKESRETTIKSYSDFTGKVKEMLVAEGLLEISGYIDNDIARNLAYSYVKEKGTLPLLMNTNNTYLIETFKNNVNKYYKLIVEKADKNDKETFKISVDDKIAFLNDLDKEKDIENVKQAIALRVSNAEEEFITNNIGDKIDMDTIISDTKTRIDNTKTDETIDDETRKGIEQESVNMAKVHLNDIRENRPRSVYEHMVRLMTESVMKNEDLRKIYCTERTVDMDKIIESVSVMYGFLETINTTKLEKVNESYIQSVFDDIAK